MMYKVMHAAVTAALLSVALAAFGVIGGCTSVDDLRADRPVMVGTYDDVGFTDMTACLSGHAGELGTIGTSMTPEVYPKKQIAYLTWTTATGHGLWSYTVKRAGETTLVFFHRRGLNKGGSSDRDAMAIADACARRLT